MADIVRFSRRQSETTHEVKQIEQKDGHSDMSLEQKKRGSPSDILLFKKSRVKITKFSWKLCQNKLHLKMLGSVLK